MSPTKAIEVYTTIFAYGSDIESTEYPGLSNAGSEGLKEHGPQPTWTPLFRFSRDRAGKDRIKNMHNGKGYVQILFAFTFTLPVCLLSPVAVA